MDPPSDLLHLLDAAAPAPRLWRSTADAGETWRGSPDSAAQVLRMKRLVRGRTVIAWSDAALRATGGAGRVLHRPAPDATRAAAGADVTLCHCETQRARMARHDPRARLEVVPEPVLPADPSVDRRALGVQDSDFLWLLTPDETEHGGRRLAAWAAALVHVLHRHADRPHRLLIAGDTPAARSAKAFVDHLGLPRLTTPVTTRPAEDLASIADAAVLAPTGPCDPFPARLARHFGLPAATTRSPEVAEVVVGYDLVAVSRSAKPRHLARAMAETAGLGRRKPAQGDDAGREALWRSIAGARADETARAAGQRGRWGSRS